MELEEHLVLSLSAEELGGQHTYVSSKHPWVPHDDTSDTHEEVLPVRHQELLRT